MWSSEKSGFDSQLDCPTHDAKILSGKMYISWRNIYIKLTKVIIRHKTPFNGPKTPTFIHSVIIFSCNRSKIKIDIKTIS